MRNELPSRHEALARMELDPNGSLPTFHNGFVVDTSDGYVLVSVRERVDGDAPKAQRLCATCPKCFQTFALGNLRQHFRTCRGC